MGEEQLTNVRSRRKTWVRQVPKIAQNEAMRAVKVGYATIRAVIKLVAGDIDRIPDLSRAVATAGSIVD